MIALILALAAAAQLPAQAPVKPGPNTVSGVEVTAPPQGKPPPADAKIEMQGADNDVSRQVVIWPGRAYSDRANGEVSLSCRIDVHGLAEHCDVVSETPRGRGFGKAALELRPTFKIAPAMGPSGPVDATRIIAITFKAPRTELESRAVGGGMKGSQETTVTANPLQLRAVTMLDNPVWVEAASFDDVAHAYPAKAGEAEGYAVAHCLVLRSGALSSCQLIKETPERLGFGQAALSLALKFRVAPQLAAERHADPLWVDVPIRFAPPRELAEHTVMAPSWLTGVDARATLKLFPPEAAANGLTTGRGVARCAVAADGSLSACVPEPGDPDGLGFSEAAAQLASRMRMNLWSADGGPVLGGVVHIPVRLNLKAGG